jgi:hypothetical protein
MKSEFPSRTSNQGRGEYEVAMEMETPHLDGIGRGCSRADSRVEASIRLLGELAYTHNYSE